MGAEARAGKVRGGEPPSFLGNVLHAGFLDPDGGRFFRSAPQDADHAPIGAPASCRAGNKPTSQCAAIRFRSAEGDTHQLRPPSPGNPEPRRASSFPATSGGPE